jgi:hypothetical protein
MRILLLVSVLLFDALAHQKAPVTVREVAGTPDAVLNQAILLTGVVSVLKDDTTLWDASDDTSLGAYIWFTSGWETRSSPAAVRHLNRMRRTSKMHFPHRGINVVELRFKSADVLVAGTLVKNPDYQPYGPSDDKADMFATAVTSRRTNAMYRFDIDHIVQLRERRDAPSAAEQSDQPERAQ